ncbi:unnamed protein product [Ostreobium quekettii]|uniref:N-acetyltransferase domain-containing protein n=1 Tax=Ostreobium quekettii TaxID=121088 RepID=A0A8S1J2K0_9CHLO|nr:unnamed protein product [Ostreobium quekettii]
MGLADSSCESICVWELLGKSITQHGSGQLHTSRVSLSPLPKLPKTQDNTQNRVANHDTELEASAWLRAVSFYVHPEERKFSGQLQRLVKAQEEFQLLKERNVQREFGVGQDIGICLVAVLAEDGAHGEDTKLLIDDGRMVVLGTLDVVVARALQGQALIGNAHSAAYLANVCVSSSARRRGVGQKLVDEAVQIAQKEGVDCVYVHIYASNTIGRRFYESCGFVVEQEEDLNMARRRGQNMDGQPGSGRTVLMKFVL